MPVERFHHLRECELESALLQTRADLAAGRAVRESAEAQLSGDLSEFWSLRINDQWRLLFRWVDGDAFDVDVVDYH
jgi:proteic killer suppression protein